MEAWGRTDKTEFDRWILKAFLCSSQELRDKPYFALCLNEIDDYDKPENLFVALAERIFFNSQFSPQEQLQYAKERREDMLTQKELCHDLVPLSTQDWMKNQIIDRVKTKHNLTEAINLCTGCFDFEKVLFLGWYSNHENNGFSFTTLQKYYPDLSNYLKVQKPINLPSEESWAIDYLRCYREAKVKDKLTDEVRKYISERNANAETFYNWYHSFKNEHELLAMAENEDQLKPDIVYWIDGLGAEYFSAVKYFITSEHSCLNILYSEIGRSNVPSSTDLNRFEGNNVIHWLALDEKGHDSHLYKPYQTLIEELSLVKDLIHRIINENRNHPCTIAIVSDHGMSALSRKAQSKKYNKAEHEGRFIEVSDSRGNNDKDYIFHTNERDGKCYKIALTHSSIGNAPVHEVHGGCTPEEVLVPFFILTNKNKDVKDFKIELINKRVPISNAVISVEIMPEPTSVKITVDGNKYDAKRMGTQWSVKVTNAKEGKHKLTVTPAGGYNKELEIEIYGIGFSGEDINDLFNDF